MSKKRMGNRFVAACLAFSTLLAAAAPMAGAASDPSRTTTTEAGTAQTAVQDQTTAFTDLGNSYAKDAINHLASLQIINGQGEGLFYPQKTISRQDIAVLLTKVAGLLPKSAKEASFADVPVDSPYAPYVYGLSELGVMNGRNDGTVGAADPLTRQELAVLLARLMKESHVAKAASTSATSYSDEEEMAGYAREAIADVTNQRWMQGANGKFNPLGTVTRAEAAVIAERVLNARYQQAEQAQFTLNAKSLSLMAGTSERLRVASANGEKLPFTPIFAFDRPELGTILPDGTFVAGPAPGRGNVTVTVGYHSETIPVEITNAPKTEENDQPVSSGEQAADTKVQVAEPADAAAPAEQTTATDSQEPAEEEEEAAESAEQDDLVNVAPGSFTSVKTFGPPDSYFQTVEKQYPGPVGGLVTPSEEWTGYNRQFGRKVTVTLSEAKPLERVALTFRQQKTSGITLPESMDVEVSRDGKAWSYAGKAVHDVPASEEKQVLRTLSVTLPDVEARYVRVSFPVKVFAFARQLEVWANENSRWDEAVLLPPPSPTQMMEDKKAGNRVENMLLAYSGAYGDRGNWTKDDFLPMVGYRTADGYMRDQMFDTILFLPYQDMPATKVGWQGYLNDLFGTNRQLDALNSAMREYNRLRGTLYTTPTQEKVVLALPYPNMNQTNFGKLADNKPSLSFNPTGIGEEQAYENRKQALEWYFQELQKRWNKAGYSYLQLEGIYWFHELIEDSAPKERDLIRSMASMVHDEALRFYWIPYYGAPGAGEWKSLYFDYAFLQPNYYSDKPVQLDRIEGVLDAISKYGMGVEIEGDERMYRDPKFYQTYYNQLVAAHKLGMDKNNVHAYYYGSKTLIQAATSTDQVVRGIYDDTYKWMRGKFDREEYYEANEMP
ncbi:DUF4855 domain-containing protein [Brevibacillus choshinensis]|uniref:DUF4855 domain-containing protein n=1 Tax=Brevibacillus choshinensis TaxID=54911 RepID=A0ABX7FNP3_BRECH|nr:DUF4855 domain-containing protein [Brevibacillus choshinensis]QRG67455.1 DUF4855 domain-containing protein [Brevibacillus choshinensis]